jgi:tetratricopeptide (TPR) repeat protein
MVVSSLVAFAILVCVTLIAIQPALSGTLAVPATAHEALDKIYSGDFHAAVEVARGMEQAQPKHPLGYILEAEALWWKIWCTSAEFKYGMTYARHRPKLSSDQPYLDLATKASSLAEAEIARHDSAEMRFYAGMGAALAARLYSLRGDNHGAARAGVHAREHLLRAVALDPQIADADFGLGLYNYYADTLSAIARVLRFFMGIPGGNKQQGIRQLEHAMDDGVLTQTEARFYMAVNLHNYDHQYERALQLAAPLVEKYPSDPLFQLIVGDLFAKLGHKERAAEYYRAATALQIPDQDCRAHVQDLARASLAAVAADPQASHR